ncbi:MAG: hypothetical protein HDS64_02645 [Bacteroidales bacterium]|nr:hypothetical protein [Bacteroidales bacterium]MBD5363235.1 hypothetical protein [Bacteroides sp.]MBD5373160.1 hypothetical protein [Bacteroides sp.]
MIKRLITIIVTIVLSTAMINGKHYRIFTHIFDVETGERLFGSSLQLTNMANGELMGNAVDHNTANEWNPDPGCQLNFFVNPSDSIPMQLTIKRDGYKDKVYDLTFNKDFPDYIDIDNKKTWIIRKDCEEDIDKLIKLQEVTVVATKVKMVMHGDTIVYDASAFKLTEGSMLDALVEQLPGVRLDNNGRMTINGEFISSLLVDGKEFFKGDSNVALRNLPSYTVKNVNVYQRDEHFERFGVSEHSPNELPWVMDVRLKPQYHKGFLGNVELGYGTDNRYLGRFFGLEYTYRGRVAAYGAINNINNETAFQGGGSWGGDRVLTGLRRIIKAGVDCSWEKKWDVNWSDCQLRLKLNLNAIYTNSDVDIQNHQSSEEFLPNGSNYISRKSASLGKDNRVNCIGYIALDIPVKINGKSDIFEIQGHPSFNFSKGRTIEHNHSARFERKPDESKVGGATDSIFGSDGIEYGNHFGVIYRNSFDATGNNKHISAGDWELSFRPWWLNTSHFYTNGLMIDWSYDKWNNSDVATRTVEYSNPAVNNIFMETSTSNASTNWHLNLNTRQIWEFDKSKGPQATITLKEGWRHDYKQGIRNVYEITDPFETMVDAIHNAINSYYSRETVNREYIMLAHYNDIAFSDNSGMELNVSATGGINQNHLIYQRAEINADMTKIRADVNPDLKLKFHDVRHYGEHNYFYTLRANLNMTHPELVDLIDYTDNLNPLMVYQGNPKLKTTYTFNSSAQFEFKNRKRNHYVRSAVGFTKYFNRKGQRLDYDSNTGVSTYKPINVDGAYLINGGINFTLPCDRDNRWYISSESNVNYRHTPDWISVTGGLSELSTVHNIAVSQNVALTWNASSNYKFDLSIDGRYNNVRSQNEWFSTLNVGSIATKLKVRMNLPWRIDCNTEFTFKQRMGYGEKALDTSEYIWNLSATRAFDKGRWVVRVDAFDILGQIDNISTQINSLGRTETWTNSLHRYVMLSLSYRFSIMPRNAKTNLQ